MSAPDGKPRPGVTELVPSPYGGEARPAGSAAIPPTFVDGGNVDAPSPGATALVQGGYDPSMAYPPAVAHPAPQQQYYAPPPTPPMVAPSPPMPHPAPGHARSKRGQGPSLVLIGAIAFVLIGGVVTAVALVRRPSNDDDGPVASGPVEPPVTATADPGPPPDDPQPPPDPAPDPPPPVAPPPQRRPGSPRPPRPGPSTQPNPQPSTQPSSSKPKPKPAASNEEPRGIFPIPIPFF